MTRTSLALLMFASLTVGASAVQAQTAIPPTGANSAGNLASHKQKELAKIQEHMQILQTLQSCVSGAADATAIKSCNETAQAAKGGHAKKC